MKTTITDNGGTNTFNRDATKYTLLIMGYFGLMTHKDYDTQQEAEDIARKFYELSESIRWDNIKVLHPGTADRYEWESIPEIEY